MATIFVTGGGGFIGSAVCEALAKRGDKAIAFDVAASPRLQQLKSPLIEFRFGDIVEWPQLADAIRASRPSAVIHTAAIVGISNSVASPIRTFEVNVGGSFNVLEAMRLFGAQRLVHLSSEETYGPFAADMIDESHPNRPVKPYGISKYAVERLANDYVAAYGLECIHARICWVYGPGLPRPRVPKTLIDAAVAGHGLRLESGGDFRVDHTYIEDCVDGLLRILDKPQHRYDVYHIAEGEAYSLTELFAFMRELAPGCDFAIGPGPYKFADGSVNVRKGALDITRARQELGYAPRFPLKVGLADYLERTKAGLP